MKRPDGESVREAPAPGDGMTLEGALGRIEEIAGRLETGALDLETSLALYREARDLHAFCVARLAAAEHDLQILMSDGTIRPEAPDSGGAAAE
jgi:exodeoxyribonuclease VII small subunit